MRRIGSVTESDVLAEARRWRSAARTAEPLAALPAAGSHVPDAARAPDDARELRDLPPWDHQDLYAAARAHAAGTGGLVVSSGGTTGPPKPAVIAAGMGIPRMLPHWSPLGPGDVLLNLFTLGKMWGAHHFYNALALHSRCAVAPMGALHPEEVRVWAEPLTAMGISALAGAPNVIARFAEAVLAAGVELPAVRAVIWAGEPMTPARASAVRSAFPRAGLWANYGSIETFPIGVNAPECRPDVLHLLPGQLLELDEAGALLTRTGEGWPSPAVRFRLGDRLRPAECACGRGDTFSVAGRADDRFKMHGSMLRVADILHHALRVGGVEEAQVILYQDAAAPGAATGLCLHYTGDGADPARIRRELVGGIGQLAAIDGHAPETLAVEQVRAVQRNERTNKVLPSVWRDGNPRDGNPRDGEPYEKKPYDGNQGNGKGPQ